MAKFFRESQFVLAAVALLLFVVFALFSKTFFNLANIMNVLQRCVELGLLSIGMTLCLMTGGINLSLPALCSFNTVIIAMFSVNLGLPVVSGILVSLLASILGGLLNGYLIACLKVAPMLATLGTQACFTGLGLVLTGGGAISGLPASYTYLGNGKLGGFFPAQLVVLIIVAAIMMFFMKYAGAGRKILLVGTNSKVAEFCGINSTRIIITAYVISSFMAFLAAVIISSRLASGRPDVADAYLMQTIVATILGGASVAGGKGSILGCLLGVLVFSLLSNGLVHLLTANAGFYAEVVNGVLLLALLSSQMLTGDHWRSVKRKFLALGRRDL